MPPPSSRPIWHALPRHVVCHGQCFIRVFRFHDDSHRAEGLFPCGGHVLRDVLRTTDDVTTRFGGEEFAVILPGTDKRGALIAGERLRSAVDEARFEAGDDYLRVTISVGIATYDPTWAACTVEELIAGADDALYKAKDGGRNQVRCFAQVAAPSDDGVTNAEKDALLR